MRKLFMFLIILLCVPALVACGGKKGKKTIEATITDVAFILTSNDQNIDPESKTGTIKVDVNVKNKTKQSIDLYPQMDMYLYDGDDQIDSELIADPFLSIEYSANPTVGPEKQKNFTAMFNVEKDKEYELVVESRMNNSGEKGKPITLKLDMIEYSDSYELLNEPSEALQAYIETIYFGKTNEKLNDLMNVNIEEKINDAEKGFTELLKDVVYRNFTEDLTDKYYDVFKKVLKDKGKIEIRTKGNSNEKAIVELRYASISSIDVTEDYEKVRQEYLDETGSYNFNKADKHALSQLETIIENVSIREARNPLEIYMMKKDGKWSFENKFLEAEKELDNIFSRGRVY